MSQRDLVAELRAARPVAPFEVRERVRLIAAADTTSPRRRPFLLRRRALVVLLPAAAAAVAAAVVLTRPTHQAQPETLARQPEATASADRGARALAPTVVHGAAQGAPKGAPVAPSPGRLQRYDAYLSLRVPTPGRVSDAAKRALRIAASLGGYPVSVHAQTARRTGTADLTLRIPRVHVQQAVTRLSQLGTIAAEQVDVQDLQAGVNAADRTIGRLQARLRDLRAQTQTPARDRGIAALTAQVQRLQRARAATFRRAHFASVNLHLETPPLPAPHKHHGHGPLHGLGIAFRWIGIGAVYALALGVPLLALVGLVVLGARAFGRRREDALLSRP